VYSQNGDERDNYFNDIVKNFNIESKKNEWDIDLISDPYSNSNKENYNSYLENRLQNDTANIDMFIFNHIYMKNYADYLQNLKLYIPNYHLKHYLTDSGKQTNIYNNHIYSLVNTYNTYYH